MKRILFLLSLSFLLTSLSWSAEKSPASSSKAAFDMGVGFFSDRKYAEAVHYFKKAVEKDKKNWLAFEMLGEAYSRLNLVDDALDAYEKSLKINPKNKANQGAISQLKELKSKAVPDSGNRGSGFTVEKRRRVEAGLKLLIPFYSGNTFDRDAWKPDWAFGVEFLEDLDPVWSLGGRLNYYLLKGDAGVIAGKYFPGKNASATPPPALMKIMQIMPQLKFNVIPGDSVIQPFLTAGAGWMGKGFDRLEYNVSPPPTVEWLAFEPQNSFSMALGVGLPLRIHEAFSIQVGYEKVMAYGIAGNDNIDTFDFGFLTRW